MCELLRGVATRVGIKQAGDGVKYLYRTVDSHMEHEKFFSGNEEGKATVLREVSEQERPLQAWTVEQQTARCFLHVERYVFSPLVVFNCLKIVLWRLGQLCCPNLNGCAV